jgi:hypothetical protein
LISEIPVQLEAIDLGEPDPQYLKQGDVYSGVLLSFAGLKPAPLRRLEDGHFELLDTPEDQSFGLVELVRSDAIVLTYDCEIDRVLRWIRDGKQFAHHHVCTVAAVYRAEQIERSVAGTARKGGVTRYLCIESRGEHAERFVDFSTMQNIPLERLLGSNRLFGVATARGAITLMQRFAYFFGSDKRKKNVGPDEPDLLRDTLKKIGR